MAHTITALVQNESGTLNRLVSLFRRRAFSLASLNAGDCEETGLSRVTIVVDGDDNTLRQCVRQLDKLVDVVEVEDLPQSYSVQRELALVTLKPNAISEWNLKDISGKHLAQVIKSGSGHLTLEISAPTDEIDAIISELRPYGVQRVVRSGLVAIRVEDPS